MAQERELPANLHDLLMVRLDSLGPARTVAQLAATVGREFASARLKTFNSSMSGFIRWMFRCMPVGRLANRASKQFSI